MDRQTLLDADDLSDGSSSQSSSGRRVSTASVSTDYNPSAGPAIRSQSTSDYWPTLQTGMQMPLPDLNQMSRAYSTGMLGLSPRAGRMGHPSPMHSLSSSHNDLMASGMELNVQQATRGSRSPAENNPAYQSGQISTQAHYMNYNYPDPQYSPQSQEAYYAMQNLRQPPDTTTEHARQPGRGSWNKGTQ